MPRMPFSGVRISCDTIARKRDLARLAVSAWSRASPSARFRHDAVGDIAADALDFGLAVFAAHIAFAPGDPARAGRGRRSSGRACARRRTASRIRPVREFRTRSSEPCSAAASRPASAQKASLAKVMTPSCRRRTIRSPCDSRKARERCSASCNCHSRSDNSLAALAHAPRPAAPDAVAVDQERHEGAGEGEQRGDADREQHRIVFRGAGQRAGRAGRMPIQMPTSSRKAIRTKRKTRSRNCGHARMNFMPDVPFQAAR